MAPHFIGPFQVLQKLGHQAYKLQLPQALSHHHPVFHVSLLKKAPSLPSPLPGQHFSSPPTTLPIPTASGPGPLTGSPDIYEVDRIVAERSNAYKVRWLGYDASEDTWIKKTELRKSAPEVVTTWHNSISSSRILRERK